MRASKACLKDSFSCSDFQQGVRKGQDKNMRENITDAMVNVLLCSPMVAYIMYIRGFLLKTPCYIWIDSKERGKTKTVRAQAIKPK